MNEQIKRNYLSLGFYNEQYRICETKKKSPVDDHTHLCIRNKNHTEFYFAIRDKNSDGLKRVEIAVSKIKNRMKHECLCGYIWTD